MHLSLYTALKVTTQLPKDETAVVSIKFTFGGYYCPMGWGASSEYMANLAKELLDDQDWDPKEIYSPFFFMKYLKQKTPQRHTPRKSKAASSIHPCSWQRKGHVVYTKSVPKWSHSPKPFCSKNGLSKHC